MPTSQPQPIDAGTQRLIEASLERREHGLPPRERLVEALFGSAFLAGAVALAVLAAPARPFSLTLAIAFVVIYAAVGRVVFRLGDGSMVPTELVFVPMLLLLPTPLVPLLVVAATVVQGVAVWIRGRQSLERLALGVSDAAFALAPAAVPVALGAQTPEWRWWPAYVAAFVAQFGMDCFRDAARAALAGEVSPRAALSETAQTYRIDVLLAPVGLLAAVAAAGEPATALLVLPLVSLLAIFSREREGRILQTIELGRAYRGTALLLRDLLEDEDEYTGHHTEDVVDLSVRVAETLGVDEDVRRETELGALLHDIGKIAIPDAILNKPGKLDAGEWEIMKTHTIEGQKMLDQVGGLLGSVGVVVRASHESFDGRGYPDGLSGEAIPLAARIVAACDSFNAMTTTRSYRKALSLDTAVEEMRRCSGTQFDPRVVDALLEVVGEPGWELTLHSSVSGPAAAAAVAAQAAVRP